MQLNNMRCLNLNWFKQCIQRKSKPANLSKVVLILLFSIWLGIVVLTLSKHEFWRDEVRSLSLSKNATSLFDLYQLLKHDGHPILWHLILFLGTHINKSNLVLPISSLAVAIAAIIIFLKFSPFPIWFKAIFIFCGFPLYEYSVMARPYGLSMLLLFITACIYKYREKHPIWLAIVLALLANTNVHSVILVVMIMLYWLIEDLKNSDKRLGSAIFRLLIPTLIIVIGIILNLVFTLPREDSIVLKITNGVDFEQVLLSTLIYFLLPNVTFFKLFPTWVPAFFSLIILFLALVGLIGKPRLFLISILTQVAFGILFTYIYVGDYRHQGLFLVFLVFLYWIAENPEANNVITLHKERLARIGNIALTIIIILNVYLGLSLVYDDVNHIRSSSKQLGEYLNDSTLYKNAIIVAEPDYLIESLPFYANNQIFFPRENRFGQTVKWTSDSKMILSISDLLHTAQEIQSKNNEPVLIILGHFEIYQTTTGNKEFSYNKTFTWDGQSLATFLSSTKLVTVFDDAYTDENYLVFALNN